MTHLKCCTLDCSSFFLRIMLASTNGLGSGSRDTIHNIYQNTELHSALQSVYECYEYIHSSLYACSMHCMYVYLCRHTLFTVLVDVYIQLDCRIMCAYSPLTCGRGYSRRWR